MGELSFNVMKDGIMCSLTLYVLQILLMRTLYSVLSDSEVSVTELVVVLGVCFVHCSLLCFLYSTSYSPASPFQMIKAELMVMYSSGTSSSIGASQGSSVEVMNVSMLPLYVPFAVVA